MHNAQLVVPPVLSCVLAELDVPEVIGRECVAMTRLQRQAADAFSVLETAQANMVSNVAPVNRGLTHKSGVVGCVH